MRKRKSRPVVVMLSPREAGLLAQAVSEADIRGHRDILFEGEDPFFPGRELLDLLKAQSALHHWLSGIAESECDSVPAERSRDGWTFILWACSSRFVAGEVCRRIDRALYPPARETVEQPDPEVVAEHRSAIANGTFDDRIIPRPAPEKKTKSRDAAGQKALF